MAGAGYRLFVDGEILTAAQVNTYMNQQTVMVFASSTARTTALASVLSEGMFSYLLDTNQHQYYDGAAWISVADISTAQTLTNKTLTSPILTAPANGFRTQATANSTLTLTVADAQIQEFTGTTAGQIVQLPAVSTLNASTTYTVSNLSTQSIAVNSSGGNLIYTIPAGATATFYFNGTAGTAAASWSFRWDGASTAPSAGTVANLGTTTLGATQTTITFPTISGAYKNLRLVWNGKGPGASTAQLQLRFNADTGANYDTQKTWGQGAGTGASETFGATLMGIGEIWATSASGEIIIPNYALTTLNKNAIGTFFAKYGTATGNMRNGIYAGSWRNSAAITQIDLTTDSGDFQIGTSFTLYGEN